jgi:hypothetical protein
VSGDGQNQLQISVPLPFKKIFRTIPLSAHPISLDSPFKYFFSIQLEKFVLSTGLAIVVAIGLWEPYAKSESGMNLVMYDGFVDSL